MSDQTASGFVTLAGLIAALAVVCFVGWLAWKGAKARPGDAVVLAVGVLLSVLFYPVTPVVVLATVGVLIWRASRRRAARAVAAGEKVDPATARAWAKAAGTDLPSDPEFSAVAARCQGKVWPEAMIGAGLARRAHVEPTGEGVLAAVGVLASAARRSHATIWDDATSAEWYCPEVVSVAPSPVGAVIKVQPLAGQGPADFASDLRADRIAAHLRVPVEVSPSSPDGLVTLTARWRDPMRDLAPLTDVPAWSGDWKRLPLGTAEDGSTVTMRLAGVSGTVVGGLPDGGKTASLATALAPLVVDGRVQFAVFDGKGGSDLAWLEPRAVIFNNDDENLLTVAEQLEGIVAVMRHRMKTIRALRGGSSIWNTGGPSEDLPLLCVLVDECQSFLDKSLIMRGDKEAESARARCEAALATLVRKGRSVGVWVILATQKPTSDSLPSTIGANASTAISFRVKTSAAEIAVFGEATPEGEPSPRDLPEVPGYAVMKSESGAFVRFRAAYLPEARLEALAKDAAALRRPDAMTAPAPEDQGEVED